VTATTDRQTEIGTRKLYSAISCIHLYCTECTKSGE